MLSLIKKDFILIYANKWSFLIYFLLVPFIVLLAPGFNITNVFIYSVLTLMYLMTRIPFSYELKNSPTIFIQSLPVTKDDVVTSKYLSIFLNFILVLTLTSLYTFILSLFDLLDFSKLTISTLLFSITLAVVFLCIQLPLEFNAKPNLASFITLFLYINFSNTFIYQSARTSRFIDIVSNYKILVLILLAILYIRSMKLSMHLYKVREFD